MSKGSMFWGNATGKLGQTVLSTVNGQQITRAYQPNVKNPRSTSQQLQRARFATAVKFYKHASANFFPFAYEDKKKTESFYNAFMRHNTNVSMITPREAYLNNNYPALGNEYMLTAGSLQSINVTRPTTKLTGETPTSAATWIVDIPLHFSGQTWGNFSELMLQRGYENGDIITFVLVTSELSEITGEPTGGLNWAMAQAILDSSSTETSISSSIWKYRNDNNDMLSLEGKILVDDKFVIMSYLPSAGSVEHAAGFAAIISRITTTGVKVCNSYLLNNVTANEIYQESLQPSFISTALSSWGRELNEAILKGAIAKNV